MKANKTTALKERMVFMTSFKEQLKNNTKTKQQITNEQQEKTSKEIIDRANYMYDQVKKELLKAAQSGEYTYIEGKKHIIVRLKSSYINSCVKRANKSKYYKSFFSSFYSKIDHKLEYRFVPDTACEQYIAVLKQLGLEDGIVIESAFLENDISRKRRVEPPYIYTKIGTAGHKVLRYIQASIEY